MIENSKVQSLDNMFLLYACFTLITVAYAQPSAQELSKWGVEAESPDLIAKTTELKKLAVEIQELEGIVLDKPTTPEKETSTWHDIQMTEELYQSLKSMFETRKKKLLQPKNPNMPKATAPDFRQAPWLKWTMPVKYTTALVRNSKLKSLIKTALAEIQSKTRCIRFQEIKSPPQGSYVRFVETNLQPGVCANSPMGRMANGNQINISPTCLFHPAIIHEMLHSLGFAHSQQRPDADSYLQMNWANIQPEFRFAFQPWNYAQRNQGPFDYLSVMMYPRTAFAINPQVDTIIPKYHAQYYSPLLGNAEGLSKEDVNILKKVYC